MVLSYEDAPLGDAMPYFSCRLAPLPITTFVGRSAKRNPACPAKETVFWWFKDEYLVSASPRTHTHISLHAEPCIQGVWFWRRPKLSWGASSSAPRLARRPSAGVIRPTVPEAIATRVYPGQANSHRVAIPFVSGLQDTSKHAGASRPVSIGR